MFGWLFHYISDAVLVVLSVWSLVVVTSFPEKVLAQEPFLSKPITMIKEADHVQQT